MKSQIYYNSETGVEKQGSLFSWGAIVVMLVVALGLAAWLFFSGELDRLIK